MAVAVATGDALAPRAARISSVLAGKKITSSSSDSAAWAVGPSPRRAASTRASTRALASAGTAGTVFNSSTIRLSVSSSSSCASRTFHLREAQPQELAGALDSHFQRRYAGAGNLSHFLVLEAFHVTQEKGFPLRGRQSSQRRLDLFTPHDRVHIGWRSLVMREVAVHEHAGPPRLAPHHGPTAVRQNAEQPRL